MNCCSFMFYASQLDLLHVHCAVVITVSYQQINTDGWDA